MTVDEALDELYGAPLADFVATRKQLAKELDGDDATALAKLRKPSTPAWVLNQLARHNRREVDLLLDAGHRLRQAQAGVLRGEERKAFEQARHTEADALQRLLKAAQELGASGAALTAVNEGLRAAAITEEGRELLALGRFAEPPKAAGFEAFAGIDVPERAAARPKHDAPRKSDERREAAAALRELEHRLHAAEREAEQAEKQAQKARTTADALAEEVEEAERRLRELRG